MNRSTASPLEHADTEQINRLLAQARAGEREAWARLLRRTYGDLKRMAHYHLRQGVTMPTLDTTSLVSEWYLRQAEAGGAVPNDRRHYFTLAGKIMRQVICQYARTRLAAKRGGGQAHLELEALDREMQAEAEQFVALDEALERLAADNPDLVRVVELRYFAGMTESETAEAMQTPLRTVQRTWAEARQQLARNLAE